MEAAAIAEVRAMDLVPTTASRCAVKNIELLKVYIMRKKDIAVVANLLV